MFIKLWVLIYFINTYAYIIYKDFGYRVYNNPEVIMKKLLLVVIGVFVLSMSFMFSGCAKHPRGLIGYLSYKVHNWKHIKQVNPKVAIKYNNVCWGKIYGHWDYISAHYNRLQFYNISKNCKDLRFLIPHKRYIVGPNGHVHSKVYKYQL